MNRIKRYALVSASTGLFAFALGCAIPPVSSHEGFEYGFFPNGAISIASMLASKVVAWKYKLDSIGKILGGLNFQHIRDGDLSPGRDGTVTIAGCQICSFKARVSGEWIALQNGGAALDFHLREIGFPDITDAEGESGSFAAALQKLARQARTRA